MTRIAVRDLVPGRAPGRPGSCLVALVLALACSDATEKGTPTPVETSSPLSVYVVNHPLEYFTQRIGGGHVDVVFPAPADIDPAFWLPPPETIAAYQKADLIIENGAGYARWTGQASLPRGSRVDTSAGFKDRLIQLEDATTHGHGPGGEHSHGATAFTTWLDPTLATFQARAIAEALIARRPDAEADFRAGLAALEADLATLDRQWAAALAPLADSPLLFSHPVYQYFARRYGLEGRSLHWEPGVVPDDRAWSAFDRLHAEAPARVLLFEGEPHPSVRDRLSAMGIRTILFEPAGNRPAELDWLATMHSNVERLAPAETLGESH